MNLRTLCKGIAILTLAGAGTAAIAQESMPTPEFNQPSKVSRAEVQADLALWTRAGLASLNQGDRDVLGTPEYRTRVAEYQRLRNSPEYAAELQRQRGGSSLAGAPFGAQSH